MSNLHGPCAVYILIDPSTRIPFYVGISNNPWYRFVTHRTDRCSAPWAEVNRLLRVFPVGHILKVYKWCATREEAFDLEYRLICSIPNLLNRDQHKYVLYKCREAA